MRRCWHTCHRRLAQALAAVELHRVTYRTVAGRCWVIKQRSLATRLLIPLGNVYLRMIGAESVVLSTKSWQSWEVTLGEARATGNQLQTPLYPGTTLHELLRAASAWNRETEQALQLALLALRALHHRTVEIASEGEWSFSHGDATAENVVVDLPNQAATWFDFDTRHRLALPALDRQADDVRALVFSAAACLPASAFADVANLCVNEVESREVLALLRSRLVGRWRRPHTFHLAQAPLTYRDFEALRGELIVAIDQSTSRSSYPSA